LLIHFRSAVIDCKTAAPSICKLWILAVPLYWRLSEITAYPITHSQEIITYINFKFPFYKVKLFYNKSFNNQNN